MSTSVAKTLKFGILLWVIATIFGCYQCIKGHNYSVAAQHESTVRGRVVHVSSGKGGPTYRYLFSVNGVSVDDYSEVCDTPLQPDACWNNGPVLVFYSDEPFSNSRLQDFAVASSEAYRAGKSALIVGLPLILLSWTALAVFPNRNENDEDPDPEEEGRENRSSDQPDDIHVVPGE